LVYNGGGSVTEQRERVAEFGRELREEPEPSDRSIKEIVDALRPQVQQLVAKQVELAKLELAPVGRQAGVAVGLLVAGAVFLLLFLLFFFLAGMYIMNAAGFPPWVSAGIVAVILLVIGGILAGAGANILRKLDPKPHRTVSTLQQNVNWIKGQFRS
jgi:tetrahydromethanopterin S-methyltransferase subunit F